MLRLHTVAVVVASLLVCDSCSHEGDDVSSESCLVDVDLRAERESCLLSRKIAMFATEAKQMSDVKATVAQEPAAPPVKPTAGAASAASPAQEAAKPSPQPAAAGAAQAAAAPAATSATKPPPPQPPPPNPQAAKPKAAPGTGAKAPVKPSPNAAGAGGDTSASSVPIKEIDEAVWSVSEKTQRSLSYNLKRVKADFEELRGTFFPKMVVPHKGASAILALLVSLLWFAVYLNKFYHSDRSEHRDWSKFKQDYAGMENMAVLPSHMTQPDMILVIKAPEINPADVPDSVAEEPMQPQMSKRPSRKSKDGDEPGSPMSTQSARRVFGSSGQPNAQLFPRLTAHMSEKDKKTAGTFSPTVRMSLSALGEYYRPYSKDSIRAKLLQDMQESLPALGFDVQIIHTTDRAWRMVCVSLNKEEAIAKYLTLYNIKLQLRKEVVQKLGIKQPANEPESSPALIRYDPRIVESLHKIGTLSSNDPKELYRRYRTSTGSESIIAQSDRFRIMYKELTDHMDVEAAKEEGLLEDVFPAHDERLIWLLQQSWASWKSFMDVSFCQPVHDLRAYFGSQLAFSFAFVGFFSKMLFALVPLSVLYEVAVFMVSLREEHEGEVVQTKQMLGFGIVLVLWARLAANLWDREEAFLVQSWEVDAVDHLQVVRSKFQGTYQPSPVDAKVLEKQYPAERAAMWRFLSGFITAVGCIIVTTFLFLERTVGGSNMYVSTIITIQMIVCEFGYDYLAGILTDWENHKEHEDHYNSLLWKQSIFQSVNNYYPFLHIIIQQAIHYQEEGGCSQGFSGWGGGRGSNCLSLLREQISLTLLFLSMIRVLQAQCACMGVWLMLRYRKYAMRWAGRTEANVGQTRSAAFIEKQHDFSPFYDRKQVWMLLYPVLSLGHVLLFSAAAPSVVFLCFLVFAANLRASAYLIANYTKRPLPVDTRGIGEWRAVVHALMKVGVVCTGFLLVTYGETFRNAPLITRVSGFLLFNFMVYVLDATMDIVFPREDKSAKLLAARRLHVERTIMRTWSGLPSRSAAQSGHTPIVRSVSFHA